MVTKIQTIKELLLVFALISVQIDLFPVKIVIVKMILHRYAVYNIGKIFVMMYSRGHWDYSYGMVQ